MCGDLFGMPSNKEYFKSVFISTDEEQALLEKEKKEKAIKAWNDKVIVDDTVFRVFRKNENRGYKVTGLQRYENILKDKPKKKSLRLYEKLQLYFILVYKIVYT